MTDAKKRAQEGLAEMVEDALSTMRQSITGKMMMVRGSTRTSDARFVLAAVLEMPDRVEQRAETEAPVRNVGDLAKLSEHIRLLKQEERKQA